MEASIIFVVFVIAIAYVFDFINGFHDAANSIATIVATGVLKPFTAVLWAAFFNFIAFLFFKLSVANTIGTGLVHPEVINSVLVFSALFSAIIWNLITWFYGLPSSSSHALIGGLVGAAFIKGGVNVLIYSGIFKVLAAILISPLLGAIFGFLIIIFFEKITKRRVKPYKKNWFKYLQLVSSAFLSLSHGANDAQKTMGIIAVLLFSASMLGSEFYVPMWVIISCNFVMALGTLMGGWRIVHTLGHKITYLNNMRGCSAETGSAITIALATHFGIPVSTTQTVTGAITGVGMTGGEFAMRWQILRRIMFAWFLTLPFTAVLSAGIMELFILYV